MERTSVCIYMFVHERVFTHKAHTNTWMKKDTATIHCNSTLQQHTATTQVFVCAQNDTHKAHTNTWMKKDTATTHCNNKLQQHKCLCVLKMIRTTHIPIREWRKTLHQHTTTTHCNNKLQQHKCLCALKMIRTTHTRILEWRKTLQQHTATTQVLMCAQNDTHKAHINTGMTCSSLSRVQRLTLQHTATHCNTLQQHTATTHCNSTRICVCPKWYAQSTHKYLNVLILVFTSAAARTATHCNTLQQHTATSRCTRNKKQSDIQVFVCALCVSFWKYLNVLFLVITSAAAHTAAYCNTLQ